MTLKVDKSVRDWVNAYNKFYFKPEEELIKVEDNMFKVGDIVVNKDGQNKCKVLAICGEVTALSYQGAYDTLQAWYTKGELELIGYKLYTEPEVKEMTVKEVSEELGYDVKIIKED